MATHNAGRLTSENYIFQAVQTSQLHSPFVDSYSVSCPIPDPRFVMTLWMMKLQSDHDSLSMPTNC
jgi:hypothetical protein